MSGLLPHRRLPRGRHISRFMGGIAGISVIVALVALAAPAIGHVPGAEVQIVKSSTASSVAANGEFEYRLIAFNAGEQAATGVQVTDDLADSLVVISATWIVNPPIGPSGTCAVGAGNTISCDVGTLAASDGNATPPEEDTVLVRIHVKAPPASCGTVDNTAHVSAENEPAENTHNDSSNTVSVTVTCNTESQSAVESKSESQSAVESRSGEGSVEAGTGTPQGSQPNTAAGLGGTSPLPTLIFSVVLLGSLAALAVANVRVAGSRR